MPELREDTVRRCATDVIEELNIDSVPIDPNEVAKKKGIAVRERSEFPDGVYGALVRDGNRFEILVSTACPTHGHYRFTVGHELGHYHLSGHMHRLLPAGKQMAVSLGGNFRDRKDPYEREADWFASELLVPERFARPAITKLPAQLSSVIWLAEHFQTSLSCAAIRFAQLFDGHMAIVLSRGRAIEWVAFSPATWEHSWARRAWKKEWVPPGAATHTLASDPSRVSARDECSRSGWLCEWFEGAPEYAEVTEDALGLGTYGRVLTVISVPTLPDADELEESESREREHDRDWRDALRGYELD